MITGNHSSLQVDLQPLKPKNKLEIRACDMVGLAGVTMLLSGAWLIFAHLYPPPLWITWIVGPILWYVGLATTVIWLLWRVFGAKSYAAGKQSSREIWRD